MYSQILLQSHFPSGPLRILYRHRVNAVFGYLHAPLFLFLFIFVDENAARPGLSVSKCKTELFTSFQNKAIVCSCRKGANHEFVCYCNHQPAHRNLKRFQRSQFLAFTLKTDLFQNAPFPDCCVFISVFEIFRFHGGAI